MGDAGDRFQSLRLALTSPVGSFLTAIRFLTIVPISWKSEKDARFFPGSVNWFPAVGLIIGAGAGFVVHLTAPYLTAELSALLIICLLGGVSGFLHFDGVADSGDGLLSSRSRTRSLEIMRDSRIGAMGVIFLCLLILGKFAAFSGLPPAELVSVTVLTPVGGRVAILLSMAILPYARKGDGLGRLFYTADRYVVAVVGVLFFIISGLLLSPVLMVFMLPALFLTVAAFSVWCYVKLGGATGDTLGCVCEFTELFLAVAALICHHNFH